MDWRIRKFSDNLTIFTLNKVRGLGDAKMSIHLYKDGTMSIPSTYDLNIEDVKELALELLELVDFIEAGQE